MNTNTLINASDHTDPLTIKFVEAITLNGCLRRSKPKKTASLDLGDVQYVWRNVAFFVSQVPQHHCMPVMADFYLSGTYADRRRKCRELDQIVDTITNKVPVHMWAGVRRWAPLIGTHHP